MNFSTKIYLASASPRRQELLRQIGVDFAVLPSDVPEQVLAGEAPADYVRRLAADKARIVFAELAPRGQLERPVLGADTCVTIDGMILGKPRDRADGLAMLRRLSGRTHQVLTAICVIARSTDGRVVEYSALSVSQVTFAVLSERELSDYWASGEPADKAGAYAIQGHAASFTERLEGSYSGVMGLPLYELMKILKTLESSA